MKIVALDISNSVKIHQEIIVENLEAARLENSLIFQIDDEPIFGIDTPQPGHASTGTSTRAVTPGSSIVLALQLRKRIRQEVDAKSGPSSDAVIFTSGM